MSFLFPFNYKTHQTFCLRGRVPVKSPRSSLVPGGKNTVLQHPLCLYEPVSFKRKTQPWKAGPRTPAPMASCASQPCPGLDCGAGSCWLPTQKSITRTACDCHPKHLQPATHLLCTSSQTAFSIRVCVTSH